MDDQSTPAWVPLGPDADLAMADDVASVDSGFSEYQRHDSGATTVRGSVFLGIEMPTAGGTIVVGACRITARAVTQGRPFYQITAA